MQLPDKHETVGQTELEKAVEIISDNLYNIGLIRFDDLKVKYHEIHELYDRIRALVRLASILYKDLAFVALEHNPLEKEAMYNDSFMVGFYTMEGPVAFHFKRKYLHEFIHLPIEKVGPLLYKDISLEERHKERINRLRSLRQSLYNIDSYMLVDLIRASSLEFNQRPSYKNDVLSNEEIFVICDSCSSEKREYDLTDELSKIINALTKAGLINYKQVRTGWHTDEELKDFTLELLSLCTIKYPELAFVSLKHYNEEEDPMYDGDFMMGLYTPQGPISFHLKLEYLKMFRNIHIDERAPRYDGYTHNDFMYRMSSLVTELVNGADKEKVLSKINNNLYLDESQKPKKY